MQVPTHGDFVLVCMSIPYDRETVFNLFHLQEIAQRGHLLQQISSILTAGPYTFKCATREHSIACYGHVCTQGVVLSTSHVQKCAYRFAAIGLSSQPQALRAFRLSATAGPCASVLLDFQNLGS